VQEPKRELRRQTLLRRRNRCILGNLDLRRGQQMPVGSAPASRNRRNRWRSRHWASGALSSSNSAAVTVILSVGISFQAKEKGLVEARR
jgi:hypothetical protein